MRSVFLQKGVRAKAALAIICICCVVAIVLQLLGLRMLFRGVAPVSAWGVLGASISTALFLFILVRVVQKGDGFALSFAVGMAPSMFLSIALLIAGVTAVSLLALPAPTSYWWMFPNLAVLELAALVGLIRNRDRSSLLTKMSGVALGLMAGWMFSNALYAIPDLGRDSYQELEQLARQRGAVGWEGTKTASRCFTQFKSASPEHRFPGSLEEFEQTERPCLGSAFKKGRKSNGQFQYLSSPDGQHFSFRLIFPAGRYPLEFQSFYLDEWGQPDVEGVEVPPLGDFIPTTNSDAFTILLYGLEYFASKHHGMYPNDLDHLWPYTPPAARSNLQRIDPNTVEYKNYTIYYSRFVDNGHTSFVLEARPRPDGGTGLSSYYADQTGVIHATSQARSATVADPIVAKCESGKPEPCTPAAVLTE